MNAPAVVMISGHSAPGACGVEDYTERLAAALSARGVPVERRHVTSLSALLGFTRRPARGQWIAHLQYPVVSWRTSTLPIATAAFLRCFTRARVLVTLHEFSRAHVLRRVLCWTLARLAHEWIATTATEARAVEASTGKRAARVIPIASNISRPGHGVPSGQRALTLAFFGLLAPGKGLETFLTLSRRLQDVAAQIVVIGQPARGHAAWAEELRTRFARVSFRLGLPDDAVARELSSMKVAYLPFPDGISERRASALAVIANGVQLVTTRGSGTTSELARIAHLADDLDEAESLVRGLLDGTIPPRPDALVRAYLDPRAWPEIARAHDELYAAVLTPPAPRSQERR